MRNWRYRFRAAFLFSQIHPHIEHAPGWTDEDAKALSKFLTTPTGARYRRTLFHHVQACAFRATMERNHAAYECGYASGARGLCSVSDSLLNVKQQEEKETVSDDLAALLP